MIDVYKALITRRGGFCKTNRFDIMFTLPRRLAIDDRGRDLSLLCESTLLPGKQITSTEWSLYGHSIKIPTNFIQEDVTCLFNVTGDYYVKRIFDNWQNLVINNETYLTNYDEDYKADIRIRQLDEQDMVVYETRLLSAYPISVQPIMLDNNAESQVQKLSVTFSYNNYIQL